MQVGKGIRVNKYKPVYALPTTRPEADLKSERIAVGKAPVDERYKFKRFYDKRMQSISEIFKTDVIALPISLFTKVTTLHTRELRVKLKGFLLFVIRNGKRYIARDFYFECLLKFLRSKGRQVRDIKKLYINLDRCRIVKVHGL